MAAKQWTSEKLSSRDKTTVSDEFKGLEKDVDLRKEGASRLFMAAEAYHRNMAKKKENEALDDAEKLLPEFDADSPFGNSLVTLGRAHCKVAKLQESYAQSFQDSFLVSLVRFSEDIKEYEALRKKLESRRLSYDAALAKLDKIKNSKKDSHDAEEEMQRAKIRYEETSDELEAHMHAIQESEIVQLRELTAFLTLEINFVEQYLDVLKDTRANWPSDSHAHKPAFPQRKSGSMRSKKSRRTSESSEDEHGASRPSSRPPSRPASRASRKRSDSAGTAGGEKDKVRLSVAGWASSAVGSVTGRGKKSRDKETFTSLNDGDGARDDSGHGDSDTARSGSLSSITRRASSKSKHARTSSQGAGTGTPKLPARILKPPSQAQRKVVRALYDFSGSSDELAFKAGDQITVVNEVLDGWWMGKLDGRQGLFPTSYTEVIPGKPPLPMRAGRRDDEGTRGLASDSDDSRENNQDDDDDVNEHYGRPLAAASTNSPFYSGAYDAASIVSSVTDDDDEHNLMPSLGRAAYDSSSSHSHSGRPTPPPMPRRSTTGDLHGAKKAPPPPPPPRRGTNSITSSGSPLIPERRPGSAGRSLSTGPQPGYMSTPASSESSHGGGHAYDRSPFESATELSTGGTNEGGCVDFKQNPFKQKGMCSNCFELHG
ncbi:hypothetical protein B0H10DRAFT_2176865 [Mycena sp. CBHHK59/15]|nr:hypothetical protein B0H10DRAFT_2176865 [Mycena sp. CBHHK59/15]